MLTLLAEETLLRTMNLSWDIVYIMFIWQVYLVILSSLTAVQCAFQPVTTCSSFITVVLLMVSTNNSIPQLNHTNSCSLLSAGISHLRI